MERWADNENGRYNTYTTGRCGVERRDDKSVNTTTVERSEADHAYYVANRASILERTSAYRSNNKDAIRIKDGNYRKANAASISNRHNIYYQKNKDKINEKARSKYSLNHDVAIQKQRAYREAHRDEIRQKKRAYSEANRESIRETMRAWEKLNRVSLNAKARAFYHANRERCREKANAANKKHSPEQKQRRKAKAWEARLLRDYGLTLAGWHQMILEQTGRCDLCIEPFGQSEGLDEVIDHDHNTKKPRALVHNKCNVGLGFFGDSLEKMSFGVEYLKRHLSI